MAGRSTNGDKRTFEYTNNHLNALKYQHHFQYQQQDPESSKGSTRVTLLPMKEDFAFHTYNVGSSPMSQKGKPLLPSSRSYSLPSNIGLKPANSGRGRSHSSCSTVGGMPPRSPQGSQGQNPALASVRLLPIHSKTTPLNMENPLDRHRTSDVLLAPSVGSVVMRRIQQVARGAPEVQLEGLSKILQELQKDSNQDKAREHISAGLLPHLRNCLKAQGNSELLLSALKVVSILVSGSADLTESVVSEGCAPYLIPLVSSDDAVVSEESVWALGNMAGDSSEVRELVLRAGILPDIIRIISSDRWAKNRDEVTAMFAQKIGESTNTLEFPSPQYSTPPPGGRNRSSSHPAIGTIVTPKNVEVRQPIKGGSVKNLIVPTIEVPRTAGLRSKNKDEGC